MVNVANGKRRMESVKDYQVSNINCKVSNGKELVTNIEPWKLRVTYVAAPKEHLKQEFIRKARYFNGQ